MNRTFEAGRRVAARLFPAENAIDAAIIDNAALIIALVKARQEAQQPLGVVQAALDETFASGAELLDARKRIAGAHARIVRLRDQLGLPEHGYGCETPCPWDPVAQPEPAAARLDPVARVA